MNRLRPLVLKTVGEFCCEAAVLVAVFGLLDRVVKCEELTWRWAATSIGCAIVLLVAGITCRLLESA
jgi:hypothetical protein